MEETSPSPLSARAATRVVFARSSAPRRPARAGAGKADDAEGGRREQLEVGCRLDQVLGVLGEVHRPVDRGGEGVHAEVLQRHPQLQGAAHPGQLEAAVGEVHRVVPGGDVL